LIVSTQDRGLTNPRIVCASMSNLSGCQRQLADHPVSHVSFASTHGKEPFTAIEVAKLNSDETITQMLWPDHCIQGEPTIVSVMNAARE
jgi:hypothetical protein